MAKARLRSVSPLFTSRWPVFLARAVTLAGFVLTILAGLFGSVVGSHNFAIIFVWIAWWTLLKLVFIPLGGRSWCAVCPIPMPGEWLTQGGIFPGADGAPGGQRIGLGMKWPRKLGFGPKFLQAIRLDGAWLQAGGFLLIGLFSAATLTTPRLTGWVLLGILILATALALVFEGRDSAKPAGRRVFCNHFCPIGGFTGLYAQAAPVEVRVRDLKVCAAHEVKTCYQACPWGVYVAALQDNGPCGMCFECVRACPNDNVSVNLRAFGKDYLTSRRKIHPDEAYLALVMLGCALAFSAVFLGPWGALRNAAYAIGTPAWLLYGAGFLLFAGGLVPGIYTLAVWAGKKGEEEDLTPIPFPTREGVPAKEHDEAKFFSFSPLLLQGRGARGGRSSSSSSSFSSSARPLLPLGLCAWIAFTISFALAKAAYILPVISDPFGSGWNLLGLTSSPGVAVSGFITSASPLLQAGVLLGGLLWAGTIARRDSAPRVALAVQVFALLVTLGMLALLIG